MQITIIQNNYIIADFKYNFKKIKQSIYNNRYSDLIIFSELSIIGYYPYDMLSNKKIMIQQNVIIQNIIQLTLKYNNTIIIGVAKKIKENKKLNNAALVIHKGKIIFESYKQLLHNDNLFNEKKYFTSKHTPPFFKFKNYQIALLICEDIWFYNKTIKHPISNLKIKNIDFIILINGSPSFLGKFKKRMNMIQAIRKYAKAPIIYCSQVGGYDNIVYDGSSFVSNNKGEIIMQAPSFEEANINFNTNQISKYKKILYPFIQSKYDLILRHLILGLKDYVLKCGFQGVIIGSSGGIDSAITLVIATLALGSKNVTAITMPSTYSSKNSIQDSIKLCKNLNIKLLTYNIQDEYTLAIKKFETSFGIINNNVTKENIQARIRSRVIMEYANEHNVLMINTSNKSELSIGYTTLYGDTCGALNCIGDLYKTEIYKLSHYINKIYYNLIPISIIKKPPSAELKKSQKDTDTLLKYKDLDAILKLYFKYETLNINKILKITNKLNTIDKKKLQKIVIMIKKTEFKRKQLCPILIVNYNNFNYGKYIPITSGYN